jgi:unsaturated chondroitin disaccharide hydrolase
VIDFEAPKEPVYYDSTAGMCAVCGMLEIAKHVSEEESKRYTQKAIQILQACEKAFCNYDENEDALVLMGSEKYPHNETMLRRVHLPIIYGDFFFVEAMMKLKEIDFMIW